MVSLMTPTMPRGLTDQEERFTRRLQRIRRDSFLSVDDLIAAINQFLTAWNEKPKPFVWTATVESIVTKLARCRQTLEQIQPGCTVRKTRKRKSS